jgi:hypothetical protein
MAQIDPSIPLQARMPQIENPVNALGRAQEVSINALKMSELQRGLQEEQQIRNYLTGADLSKPETRAGLAKFGKTGLGYGKLLAEQEKAGLETKKLGLDINAKQMDAFRERIGSLEFNPSNANIQAFLEDSVLKGEITPQEAQQRFAQATAVPLAQRPSYFRNMGVKTEERYKMNTISEYQKQSLGVQREGQAITREGQRMQYDPQLQARIAEAKASGEFMGKSKATAAAALPGALEAASEGIRLIDEMVGQAEVKDKSGKVITKGTKPHPGFSEYVGGTLVPGKRFLEGTDVASFEVRQKQIEGKAFLEAFQTLKGGGAITEKEGEKGTAAIMRMNKASNEKEYVAAARELQTVLRTGMDRARAKASGASAAPNGGVIDFNTLK